MSSVSTNLSRSLCRAKGLRGLLGMTVLELLVAVSVISTLMTLLLPAVQSSREAARNLQCQHRLRQIGMALHEYHELHEALPAGWQIDGAGDSAYGWATPALPNLEEGALGVEIDLESPVSEVSPLVLNLTPRVFLCPSDVADPTFELFEEKGEHETGAQESQEVLVSLPHANYVGVFGTLDPDAVEGIMGDGIFVRQRPHRWREATRGLSHIAMVGERTAQKLPSTWLGIDLEGEDATGRIVGYADKGPNREDADECEFDSRHPGHVNFLWCDGHVAVTRDGVDQSVYRESARFD
jgi:prepilin-type processing-associated H-X9-DG protein